MEQYVHLLRLESYDNGPKNHVSKTYEFFYSQRPPPQF